MMVNMMDDKELFEKLSKFKDGELTGEERKQIEADLSEQDQLKEKLSQIEKADELAALEFGEMLDQPVPLTHVSTIHSGFEKRKKAQPFANHWRSAIAASLVSVLFSGVIAFFAFDYHTNNLRQEIQQARVSSNAMLASMFQQALEGRSSGHALLYNDPITQISFEFKPVKTYKSASGHWCREFEERIEQDGSFEIRQGIACREQQGRWYRLKTTINGEMSRLL
ncbi:hypothetical protein GUA87_11740 [Sneathiella sp. P13V-1]|uniref:hypothetical protein n=1 Tax=Sneathiella sp. P13V-1 TaxID=2697366 RepID=UPI00187B2DE3|nr:hypothetical protein [Sneathiella sp. P13V-1]MBE7637519.1 hypothetical protein [Sneathiella sp. P13V-1]